MKFFNYNFLFIQSLTVEFGIAVFTAVFTMLSLAIIGINVSELSKQIVVLGTILLLLITWSMAIIGASLRSRNLITFAILLWIIFIIMWLVLSLYFRILKHNTHYCVADKKRCAPSMWLITVGGSKEDEEEEEEEEEEEKKEEEEEEEKKEQSKLWSVELVHPTRMLVITNPVAVTLAANTIVSNNMTNMSMIGDNNGSERDRHQRTTTESPPSDLRTRVIEYRKNMTIYRQTALQHRKKKGKKKKIDEDEEEEEEEEKKEEEEEEEEEDDKADTHTIDLLSMAGYLLLYLYALYVLLSYHNELKLMSICECNDYLSPGTKVP